MLTKRLVNKNSHYYIKKNCYNFNSNSWLLTNKHSGSAFMIGLELFLVLLIKIVLLYFTIIYDWYVIIKYNWKHKKKSKSGPFILIVDPSPFYCLRNCAFPPVVTDISFSQRLSHGLNKLLCSFHQNTVFRRGTTDRARVHGGVDMDWAKRRIALPRTRISVTYCSLGCVGCVYALCVGAELTSERCITFGAILGG